MAGSIRALNTEIYLEQAVPDCSVSVEVHSE
jgi:hypothetical protein